jgi:hypothetical protein
MYKKRIYWLNTTKFCGCVTVGETGYVEKYETAPCYRWMADKNMKFHEVLNFLKNKKMILSCKKIDEEFDPF